MHLRYDEDFVEEAVRLCATGSLKAVSSFHIARFNRAREKLYDIPDPDERNAAFFRLHIEWFREWELEKVLTRPLEEFPLVTEVLNVLAFRKSRGKNDDGTELYVNETGHRNGVVAMRPERLARERELKGFLRHELMHLQDMVNPAFGYSPELPLTGALMNQHRIARERYRLLWDVTIDGRLICEGRDTIATRAQRELEFAAVFVFWPEPKQREVFDALWTQPAPTHAVLVDLVCDPRQLQADFGPRPGAPCPLCGFPTFAWATSSSLTDSTVKTIVSEFPHWSPEQGACTRCSEICRVNRSQALSVP